VNLAAIALLAWVFGLLFFDVVTHGKRGRRMLVLESLVFMGGAFFIAFPDVATSVAHAVGIGRGVDFLLYPLVIWLVRESLVGRQRRLEDGERLTALVRAVAIREAQVLEVSRAETAGSPASASERGPVDPR
jgi:small membrane protein